MKKVTTDIEKFQYFYPYTVALVGAQMNDRINFMACAWHTALSFDPPLFGILISKKRFTHDVISAAKEFTVNFLSMDKIKRSAQFGRISGHSQDKVHDFQLKISPSELIQSPIIQEAYVSLECRLNAIQKYGDHDLFVGEVVAIQEDENSFDVSGVLNTPEISPLLYLGSDIYISIDPKTRKHEVP